MTPPVNSYADTTPPADSTPATPLTPAQPVYPPVDATRAVPPITPFPAWTWTTPVIPQFYWNVYSAEQRVRQICVEIGKIQAYLSYMAANANAAHYYLDNRFTLTETRLTTRIDALEKELDNQVESLTKLINDEVQARKDADTALNTRIDGITPKAGRFIAVTASDTGTTIDNTMLDGKAGTGLLAVDDTTVKTRTYNVDTDVIATKASVDTERNERKTADTTLQTNLDNETQTRNNADLALGTRISEETSARTEADTTLTNSLNTEIQGRKDADTALGDRVTAEETARTQADQLLTQIAYRRVKATSVLAAPNSHITVTSTMSDTDANGSTVTIGDTFTPAFDDVNNKITQEITDRTAGDAALQKNLDAETAERRADNTNLQTQIDNRLKFGAVLGANGITVTNDPDKTTTTVSVTTVGTQANTDHNIALSHATGRDAAGIAIGEGLIKTHDDNEGDHIAIDPDYLSEHAGGLSTIVTNNSLEGAGTTENPLGIKPAFVSATANVARFTQGKNDLIGISYGDGLKLGADPKLGTPLIVDMDYVKQNIGATSTTVAHDTSLTGDGTTNTPLGVATARQGGLSVATGDTDGGLKVNVDNSSIVIGDSDNTMYANIRGENGITVTQTNGMVISPLLGDGLHVDGNAISVNTGNGLSTSNGTLQTTIGDGLTFNSSNAIAVAVGDGLEIQNSKLQTTGTELKVMEYTFTEGFPAIPGRGKATSVTSTAPVPDHKIVSATIIRPSDPIEPYTYNVEILEAADATESRLLVTIISNQDGEIAAQQSSNIQMRLTYIA